MGEAELDWEKIREESRREDVERAVLHKCDWLLVAWDGGEALILQHAPGFCGMLDGRVLSDHESRQPNWSPPDPHTPGVYRLQTYIWSDGEDDWEIVVYAAQCLWTLAEHVSPQAHSPQDDTLKGIGLSSTQEKT